MTQWINPDGSVGWLKRKHASLKTKGRYKGGEHPAPRRKHPKNGKKTHIPGQWVLRILPSGKKVMEKKF